LLLLLLLLLLPTLLPTLQLACASARSKQLLATSSATRSPAASTAAKHAATPRDGAAPPRGQAPPSPGRSASCRHRRTYSGATHDSRRRAKADEVERVVSLQT
jgi:hypothetical protein